MNKKTIFLMLLVLAIGTAGYFEFVGNNETYEGLTDMVPIVGDKEPVNTMYVSYSGSSEYGNIRIKPEYLKLANRSTGDVQRTYEGVNKSFSLTELDRTPMFRFSAFKEFDVLISFTIEDPENRSLLYNELDQMKYKKSIDFNSRDSFNITINVKGAETGDKLVYSPDLDYQSPSRSLK